MPGVPPPNLAKLRKPTLACSEAPSEKSSESCVLEPDLFVLIDFRLLAGGVGVGVGGVQGRVTGPRVADSSREGAGTPSLTLLPCDLGVPLSTPPHLLSC